jgi:2-keto-3-deoxy-L-rhamnonate aldolase RhmA
MHCMMPDYARAMAQKGFDFVTLGNDVRMLSTELATRVGAFRGVPVSDRDRRRPGPGPVP